MPFGNVGAVAKVVQGGVTRSKHVTALMAHRELDDEGQASQEGQNATFQNVKEPQIPRN